MKGGVSRIVLVFDKGRPLIRKLDVLSPENQAHWTFDYSAGAPISYMAPRSARLVSAFTVTPEPPRYASPAAQRTTRAMIDANRRFTSGTIDVEGDDGHVRISLSGRKLREDQPRLSYAYDGRVLTVVDRRRDAFYRGAAIRSTVPDLIAELRGRVDPISRQILQRRVPYEEILSPRLTVALAGQAQSGGTASDILRLTDARSRVSMFVRRDNHLVESVTSDVLDASGHSMASSTRSFRYSRLGKVSFTLIPKKGQKVLPLPKLKIRL
jgi:hypothetical protein